MPAKQAPRQDIQKYIYQINSRLSNIEQRLERLEGNSAAGLTSSISRIPLSTPQEEVQRQTSESRRNFGWVLILIFLGMVSPLGWGILSYIARNSISTLAIVILTIITSLIVGIIMVANNPKAKSQPVLPDTPQQQSQQKKKSVFDIDDEEADNKETLQIIKHPKLSAEKQVKQKKTNFEEDIGKKWLPKIGIISIVLGVAFFIIYAIQNKWIGPEIQIILGILTGIILIIVGIIFYKKYQNYGLTLVGGGFAIIYFAIFSAYTFYKLLPLWLDISAISIVIIFAALFSIRFNSKIIASEAFFLGYIVPLVTMTFNTYFLIYAMLLTAGLLALSHYKGWKLLGAGGILALYLNHIIWFSTQNSDEKFILNLVLLSVYFIMFGIYALNLREKTEEPDSDSFITQKAIFSAMFGITYIFLWITGKFSIYYLLYSALLTLLLAVISYYKNWKSLGYAGIIGTYFSHFLWYINNDSPERNILHIMFLSFYFIIFTAMALNYRDDQKNAKNTSSIKKEHFITPILVISYLFLIGFSGKSSYLYLLIPLIVLISVTTLFVLKFKWNYLILLSIPLTYLVHAVWLGQNLKESFITGNLISASIYFIMFNGLLFYLYKDKNKAENIVGIILNSLFYYGSVVIFGAILNQKGGGLFTAIIAVIYLVLAYFAYDNKASHYFNTYAVIGFGYLALAAALQFSGEWITISWAIIALVLVILSFRVKEDIIRLSSSAIGIATIIKLIFVDSWNLGSIDFANPLNSSRFIAFSASILIAYIIAYLYDKNKEEFDNYDTYVVYVTSAYEIAASLLTVMIYWIEIWNTGMTLNAKKLWTSLSIILHGIALLGFGFIAKRKLFRISGLILLGVAILKVFLYDLSSLDTGYRIYCIACCFPV